MSHILDAAAKVHDKQLEIADKGQQVVLQVGERIAGLSAKAPQAPQAVQDLLQPLRTITEPLRKVVGDVGEYQSYVKNSTHDWLMVQQRFAERLVDLMPGAVTATKAAKPRTAKPRAAKNGA